MVSTVEVDWEKSVVGIVQRIGVAKTVDYSAPVIFAAALDMLSCHTVVYLQTSLGLQQLCYNSC